MGNVMIGAGVDKMGLIANGWSDDIGQNGRPDTTARDRHGMGFWAERPRHLFPEEVGGPVRIGPSTRLPRRLRRRTFQVSIETHAHRGYACPHRGAHTHEWKRAAGAKLRGW